MQTLKVSGKQLKGMRLALVSADNKSITPICALDSVDALTKSDKPITKHLTLGNNFAGEVIAKLSGEGEVLMLKGSLYSKTIEERGSQPIQRVGSTI